MSPQRYPNANYPTAYDEADMVKSGDAPVNDAGTGLTVTDVTAGQGPLLDMQAVTGTDVKGTKAHEAALPVADESEAAE